MITNPNPNIIRLAKITNPNPNIWDSEKKIRIRTQHCFILCLFLLIVADEVIVVVDVGVS